MIRLKDNVGPPNLVILAAVANVSEEWKRTSWLTSGAEVGTKHMTGSRHYDYRALDVRSKDLPTPEAKRKFMAQVLDRLGPDYQGLLEHEGEDNEHFHFEHDPKSH